jgi:type I restriction enzyme, S subunit
MCRRGGKKYPNLGILSFGRGVFEKTPIDGSATAATTLYRVKAGQFIYSRLFAFEGAYGFVPERLDGYYVSNEFPVFEVDPTITSGRFLATYFRSKEVWERLGRESRGLGNRRQRVHPDSVLALEVWLPPLELQLLVVQQMTRLEECRKMHDQAMVLLSALEASTLNSILSLDSEGDYSA